MSTRLRVGVSAALEAVQTIHARTLLRSLAAVTNWLPGSSALSLVFANDQASGPRAQCIAEQFVAQGIDVVLGPFASDCLLATAEIYAKARIPLVLPAATVCLEEHFDNQFRICPNDQALAAQIVDRVHGRGFQRVGVISDQSAHCQRLRQFITERLGAAAVPFGTASVDAAVYTGRYHASKIWLANYRASGATTPVLMTDDAAVPDLLDGIPAGDLEVVGFPAAHQVAQLSPIGLRYSQVYGLPPAYFLEVIAAAAVIAQAGSCGNILQSLRSRTFETVLGPVHFINGERAGAELSLWRPNTAGRLEAQELLTESNGTALQPARPSGTVGHIQVLPDHPSKESR